MGLYRRCTGGCTGCACVCAVLGVGCGAVVLCCDACCQPGLLGGQVRGGWFPLVGGEAVGRDVSEQCSTYSYRCMGCVCIRAVWDVVHGPVVR